jgi:hypothetical protein
MDEQHPVPPGIGRRRLLQGVAAGGITLFGRPPDASRRHGTSRP